MSEYADNIVHTIDAWMHKKLVEINAIKGNTKLPEEERQKRLLKAGAALLTTYLDVADLLNAYAYEARALIGLKTRIENNSDGLVRRG